VSWAAHLGWLNLHGTPFAFMSSTAVVVITSVLAVGEYLADQYPKTPSRVSPGPLSTRIGCGGVAGACVSASAGQPLLIGGIIGAVGGVLGAVTGYQVRGRLVQDYKVQDLVVGLSEDVLVIGLGYLLVS
jgi:uncharacterized membrane protein